MFDAVYVSTDSRHIESIAREAGAAIPFLRDQTLSDDFTGTHEVVADFIKRLGPAVCPLDRLVCCVYPTSVLLEKKDFEQSHEVALARPRAAVIGVTRNQHPPQRALRMNEAGLGEYFFPEYQFARSQDMEPTFSDAGQLYWGSAGTWLLDKSSPVDRYLFELPHVRAVDINEESDWDLAEALLRAKDCSHR